MILNVAGERKKNFLFVMIMVFLFVAVPVILLIKAYKETPKERIVRVLDSLKKEIEFTEGIEVVVLIPDVAQPNDTSGISQPDRKIPKLKAGACWNAIAKVCVMTIDKRIANKFSDEAINCLLAHERGQVVLVHLRS